VSKYLVSPVLSMVEGIRGNLCPCALGNRYSWINTNTFFAKRTQFSPFWGRYPRFQEKTNPNEPNFLASPLTIFTRRSRIP
jgi:hypothetical protein